MECMEQAEMPPAPACSCHVHLAGVAGVAGEGQAGGRGLTPRTCSTAANCEMTKLGLLSGAEVTDTWVPKQQL